MRNFIGLMTLFLFIGAPALAQQTPKLEVSGGYKYFNFGFSGNVLDMNGFEGTATYNFTHLVGITADFAGAYNDSGINGTTHVYNMLFGPTLYPMGHRRVTMFVHGLAGEGHINVSLPASSQGPAINDSDNAFAYAVGGGFDVRFTTHIAARIFEGDYVQTRFFTDVPGTPVQKDSRFSAGIVFRM